MCSILCHLVILLFIGIISCQVFHFVYSYFYIIIFFIIYFMSGLCHRSKSLRLKSDCCCTCWAYDHKLQSFESGVGPRFV